MTEIPKFSPDFQCPKCGGDKRGVRLEREPEVREDYQRRMRLRWPASGELLVSSCQICGFVQIARPLDHELATTETAVEPTLSNGNVAPTQKTD